MGRATRPNLGLGICGEHGGDPTSIEFCHNVGLDYVSVSYTHLDVYKRQLQIFQHQRGLFIAQAQVFIQRAGHGARVQRGQVLSLIHI